MMSLADYAALYKAVVHMSVDIEENVPRFDEADWDDTAAAKYALVAKMIDCITDVPNSKLAYYIKQGMTLPEVDTIFTDAPHTTINGKIID